MIYLQPPSIWYLWVQNSRKNQREFSAVYRRYWWWFKWSKFSKATRMRRWEGCKAARLADGLIRHSWFEASRQKHHMTPVTLQHTCPRGVKLWNGYVASLVKYSTWQKLWCCWESKISHFMTCMAEMAEEQQYSSITIEGLRRLLDDQVPAQCEITLNTDAPISEIWTKIESVYTLSYRVIYDVYAN